MCWHIGIHLLPRRKPSLTSDCSKPWPLGKNLSMSKPLSAIAVFISTWHPSQPAPTSLFGWGLLPIKNFFGGPSEAVHFVSSCA